jgi:regulator of protease activity HflC (stomatin/prohibitin superfamily)
MKTYLKQITFPLLAFAFIASLTGCMPYSTDSTEMGVRTVKLSYWFGMEKGVQQETYAPGTTHFFVPFLNDWHTFDTKLQILEMTGDANTGDLRKRDDLTFKTIDGNDISLDVIIQYRIDTEKLPYILEYVAETDEDLRNYIVRTIARSRPRDIFGELNTEEFYIAENRTEKAERVREELNIILDDYGVIVDRVSTRDYRFPPEYQQAIEEKKVADQMAEKHKSATSAQEQENLKFLEEAKGDIAKVKAEADGELARSMIEADAYYLQQIKIAEAIRAEGLAEAEAVQRMNEALSGSGGEAMVKLKFTEALKGMRILFLPGGDAGGLDVRSTDVNSLIDLRGIQRLSTKNADTDKPAN